MADLGSTLTKSAVFEDGQVLGRVENVDPETESVFDSGRTPNSIASIVRWYQANHRTSLCLQSEPCLWTCLRSGK